ncbi:MAG: ATP-binding protein [Clostridium sp.]
MEIRKKFTLGLSIILIVFGIVLNLFIKQVLIIKMEDTIKHSLQELMVSSRENIKYRIAIDKSSDNASILKNESINIIQYINLNYKANSQLKNIFGEVLNSTIEKEFDYILEKHMEQVKQGKVIVDINYKQGSVWGIISYPIYINGVNLGTLSISKNYDDIYNGNKTTIAYITVIQSIIFIAIFILSSIVTSRIVTPIIRLTKGVKLFSEGDYENNIKITGNDEVTVLTKEFINMKEKIISQINDIKIEKDKVEKLEKSRKMFFDNVTHEMKTPLTAITGYAELIKDNIVDNEEFKKRAIDRIYSEGERLNLLIIDLINVSKGLSINEEPKSINDIEIIINDILVDMEFKANKYGLTIVSEIEKANINCQRNKIRELIINLVDNSIKYGLKGSEIKLLGRVKEDVYEIEVQNEGESIEESILEHIFEPFIRSNKSIDGESRGLGLYICKEIVENHNGEILVINEDIIKVKIKLPLNGNKLATT